MPFSDPAVSDTVLMRSAIQSPNYVPGVSGWSINDDGSAEFTSLTVRGFIGGRFVDVRTLADPSRTVVDFKDGRTAVLTLGCRTVGIHGGPPRSFTEQKLGPTSDLFARTLAGKWGPSPAAGVWGEFGGAAADYAVSGGAGRVKCSTTGVSRYVRLNDVVGQADVVATFTTDTTPAGASNSASVITGWQGTSDHYRARVTLNTDGSLALSLTRLLGGAETTIAGPVTVGSGYVAGQTYKCRMTNDGAGGLTGTVWPAGGTITPPPQLTGTDPLVAFPTGRVGFRAFASAGATNAPTFLVSEFSVAGQWPDPPAVTHNTWLRFLPAPYPGSIDAATADWLGTAVNDTSPDLLSTAMRYVTGGDLGAGYGPIYSPGRTWAVSHADDGTKQEGADWNDYLGVTGDYPDLAVPDSDPPEAHQLGCLDCSGYLRMIFGHHFGMPMALDAPADFDGLRIPRVSADIIAHGPGNLVATGSSAGPPRLDALQPGDVLGWDADTSNPDEEEGQIDHVGIYLGLDQHGRHRMLSSRKTADGPTLGDLGGPSLIDGTGLYARSLRMIRRF